MSVAAALLALTAALTVGYLWGHRAGARTPSWRRRTSRTALVRQAAGLATVFAMYKLRVLFGQSAFTVATRHPARRWLHPRRALRGVPSRWRG
ncbi:hypothetical protein [Mycobacterium sp. SMC-4]|uniref:hypothetical protein n=1 Tax=Mycobacterium sp. SMC-4 TaxID=2857059 RepID=UPI0021B3BB2C|nr:hypothetical protein [Mycobacterium sp. SMC-4]UXA16910.1 hypothetical protein KXD98_19410 [Mycobacterium sp. SMC-4]